MSGKPSRKLSGRGAFLFYSVLTETYALHRKRLGTKYGLLLYFGCNWVWDLSGWGALLAIRFPFRLLIFIDQGHSKICNGLKFAHFFLRRK
jgi:hypothetical protein